MILPLAITSDSVNLVPAATTPVRRAREWAIGHLALGEDERFYREQSGPDDFFGLKQIERLAAQVAEAFPTLPQTREEVATAVQVVRSQLDLIKNRVEGLQIELARKEQVFIREGLPAAPDSTTLLTDPVMTDRACAVWAALYAERVSVGSRTPYHDLAKEHHADRDRIFGYVRQTDRRGFLTRTTGPDRRAHLTDKGRALLPQED